jgi:hypothetical protein
MHTFITAIMTKSGHQHDDENENDDDDDDYHNCTSKLQGK